MPSVFPAEPRRRLALAGLAVPILGLMGLFAWAGSTSRGGDPTALVQSFISSYNAGDCSAMMPKLYIPAGGLPSTTCRELRRPDRHHFLACSVSGPSPAAGTSAPSLPSGYADEQVLLARCEGISVYFYVATENSSGTARIVGVGQAP